MQVRALQGLEGEYGSLKRGQTIEISDFRAAQLIRRGLVAPVLMEAAGTASSHPSIRPTGGETGEMTSPSSSLQGHQLRQRRSKSSKDAPGS